MTSSSTSSRRILYSNIEEFSDSIENKARDSCDYDSCDCRCDCDDEMRDEAFDDRKKNASIMIKEKNSICEFDDLQTKMIV